MTTTVTPVVSFERLVIAITQAHAELAAQASRAVNTSLTLRNWLIGRHIVEYEQLGADRTQYGDMLIERLSDRLIPAGVSRAEARELRRYRQLYLTYPQIRDSSTPKLGVAASDVLTKLSFTHIAELLLCEDATKRAFYELECIRGNWSVRELRRQIASLYYERSGLSKARGKLTALAQKGAERAAPTLAIRDPYVFEFLGLKPQEVMGESQLEDQLLDKLSDFLLGFFDVLLKHVSLAAMLLPATAKSGVILCRETCRIPSSPHAGIQGCPQRQPMPGCACVRTTPQKNPRAVAVVPRH